jgi:hypothetical protein
MKLTPRLTASWISRAASSSDFPVFRPSRENPPVPRPATLTRRQKTEIVSCLRAQQRQDDDKADQNCHAVTLQPRQRQREEIRQQPNRNPPTIERRKGEHIEHGEDDIEDDCVLEIFGNPWNRVDWKIPDQVKTKSSENRQRDVHGRSRCGHQNHVTTRIMEGPKVHRHRLGVSEQKR